MSIILLGLYLFITREAIAVPIEALTSDLLSRNTTLAQVASECVCPSDQRTVWDIIWSCLATTFLCTWVTVHPNVPAPDEELWWIAWTRLKTMLWALVAPELIFSWALREYIRAKHLKEKYASQYRHWTMVHSHFLQMGGFMLYNKDGTPDRTLRVKDFDDLLDQKVISIPSITEEQIMDKSKGDSLTKLLTLLQTGWFIVQCIARWCQHLAISEMEITTLALATVNLFIYIFWWKKPLDVRQPVPVHLLFVGHSVGYTIPNPNPMDTSDTCQSADNWWRRAVLQRWHWFTLPLVSIALAIHKKFQDSFEHDGLLLTIGRILIIWPIWEPILGLIGFPDFPQASSQAATSRIATSRTATLQELLSFYYYDEDKGNYPMAVVTAIVAAVFGAIHCSAWAFSFPSFEEKILWRMSSVTVATIPLLAAFFYFMSKLTRDDFWHLSFWDILVFVQLVVYPLARLILLVEAVTTLRQLPPTAYDTVQWLDFIPHI